MSLHESPRECAEGQSPFAGSPMCPSVPCFFSPKSGGQGVEVGLFKQGASTLSQTLLLTVAPGTGKTTIIREAITESKAGGLYIDCIVA